MHIFETGLYRGVQLVQTILPDWRETALVRSASREVWSLRSFANLEVRSLRACAAISTSTFGLV